MIFSIKKIIYSVTIISVFVGISSLPLQAEAYTKINVDVTAQNDFVVEPGKTEVFLNPGENMVKNISITNRVNKTVKFKLSTEDFIGSNDAKQPVVLLGDANSPYSLKDFIIPEITEFSLEFGEKITIPVTVSVPKDAEPRGYYGALIVSNDPDKLGTDGTSEVEGKTRIISRIGSLFLLRINGEGKEEGNIENFKTIGPTQMFYSSRPAGFEIAYKNTGNVHLVPYGTITIKNIFGQTVGTLPVDAYFVLPDSIRYREVNWTNGFSLGRYTANLSLYKGYNNEYADAKLSFWIIPWKILVPVFAVILLLVVSFYYILTRFELRKK
ncbi:MAG: hypothetical protein WC609_03080 [Candidatus Paceibacterota bacterium]|jgi:hypothetical protein